MCKNMQSSQQCFHCCPSHNFVSFLLCNMCLSGTPYVPSTKVLTSCHSSCTQEGISWAKQASCKEWGKTFWSYPAVKWCFLSSNTFCIEMWRPGGLTCLLSPLDYSSKDKTVSLTTFGYLSPANMITAPPALLGDTQKHIFGIIILS